MSAIGESRADALRVSKRLLHAWFDPPAIEKCWEALKGLRLDEMPDTGPPLPSFVTSANLTGISDAMSILSACNPKVHIGPILVAFPRVGLSSHATSDPDAIGIRACRKRVWSQAQPLPSTAQPLQLEHKIQRMELLQTHRVASLVELSVRAVRDALAGTIELNVQSLLHDHPPQKQHILRAQIMLDDILGVNKLQGVEEAFATAEALEKKLGKERALIRQRFFHMK